MSDEEQVRTLLALAAEPPDETQPQVQRLIGRARRRRTRRAALSVGTAVVAVAAAFIVPAVLGGFRTGHAGPGPGPAVPGLFPARPGTLPGTAPGPSAAQLARFRWSTLPPSPLGRQSQPLLAWTGHELLELSTFLKDGQIYDGAAFVPATGRWHLIAPERGTLGFANAVVAWTGKQLFVASGEYQICLATQNTNPNCFPQAHLYDPATNTWSVISLPHQMTGLTLASAVWTGRVVIVVGTSVRHSRLDVAAYNPASRRWRMITPRLPRGHLPIAAAMVGAPGRVLLWSLWSRSTKISANDYAIRSGVDLLALGRRGRWHTVTGSWPQHTTVDSPVYAGGEIFLAPAQIWCGLCSHPGFEYQARLVNPATLARTTIPAGPLAEHFGIEPGIWLWNGRTALAANTMSYGTGSARYMVLTRLAAYDPATARWLPVPAPPHHPPNAPRWLVVTGTPHGQPIAAPPIWAGKQLLLLTSTGLLLSLHG